MACLLLLLSFHLPFVRHGVDGAVLLLRIPEYPALVIRARALGFSRWLEHKGELEERMARMEQENVLLRVALTRASLKVPEGEVPPPPSEAFRFVSAAVLVRHPRSWWDEVKIDAGSERGLRPGDPVLSRGYLVGRVRRVSPFDSWVQLITSRGFSLPAAVESTRDLGVLMGDGKGEVSLRYIPEERSLPEGFSVETTLLDESFPPGLSIGRMAEKGAAFGGFRSYVVRPGASLSRLYVVDVLTGEGEERP